MRIAWLADRGNVDGTEAGGAEFTRDEFAAAAPDGVEIVLVDYYSEYSGLDLIADCDMACVFNVALYPPETKQALSGKRVVRYWNDVAPHGDEELTRWLVATADNIFCSPLHYERFPWRDGEDIPHHIIAPPVPLQKFRDAAAASNGNRQGAVSIAPWRGWGKTPFAAQEWAEKNGPLDFYGGGSLAPPGSKQIPYEAMPQVLAQYETFVYLPSQLEPFCRTVVEAWAAGCEVVTNGLVGATWWIENAPERLETGAQEYWDVVLNG